MSQVILFLGAIRRLYPLADYDQIFKNNNYEVLETEDANVAESILDKRQVSLMIVCGFLADYVDFLDNYSKKLPPTIYWHMSRVDEIPIRKGVTLVDSSSLPSHMMCIVNELLRSQ